MYIIKFQHIKAGSLTTIPLLLLSSCSVISMVFVNTIQYASIYLFCSIFHVILLLQSDSVSYSCLLITQRTEQVSLILSP